jgi:hypothetical protein
VLNAHAAAAVQDEDIVTLSATPFHIEVTVLARARNAPIEASAIRARISPYSTAVAPLLFLRSLERHFTRAVPQHLYLSTRNRA